MGYQCVISEHGLSNSGTLVHGLPVGENIIISLTELKLSIHGEEERKHPKINREMNHRRTEGWWAELGDSGKESPR